MRGENKSDLPCEPRALQGEPYRVFTIARSAKVTIDGLTIRNGYVVNDEDAPNPGGGGLYNEGDLTLINTTVAANVAINNVAEDTSGASAGIGGGGIHNRGVLRIEQSRIIGNFVCGTGFVDGGGIYNREGTLFISSTTVSGNRSDGTPKTVSSSVKARGGGIFNREGILTIDSSTISSNVSQVTGRRNGTADAAAEGGGLSSNGQPYFLSNKVTPVFCHITTKGCKFLLANEKTPVSRDSSVADKQHFKPFCNVSRVQIINSTISDNIAFSNMTFSDDQGQPKSPSRSVGGGIFDKWTTFVIRFSTIAMNSAVGGDLTNSVQGGGILVSRSVVGACTTDYTTLDLYSTIVASNWVTGPSNTEGPDVSDPEGLGISLGHNLISNTQAGGNVSFDCDPKPNRKMDICNEPARLIALTDNLGPTQTLALAPGSPAINNGGDAGAPPWDQRGFPRVFPEGSDLIDIGAYECQSHDCTLEPIRAPRSGGGTWANALETVSPVSDLQVPESDSAFREPRGFERSELTEEGTTSVQSSFVLRARTRTQSMQSKLHSGVPPSTCFTSLEFFLSNAGLMAAHVRGTERRGR